MNQAQIEYALKMQSERYLEKGCELLGIPKFDVTYDFSLRGHTAGMAEWTFWEKKLRYNIPLVNENPWEMLLETTAHEVAHLLAIKKYGTSIRPHGMEWKLVMKLLGKKPIRCHNMQTTPVRKQRGW